MAWGGNWGTQSFVGKGGSAQTYAGANKQALDDLTGAMMERRLAVGANGGLTSARTAPGTVAANPMPDSTKMVGGVAPTPVDTRTTTGGLTPGRTMVEPVPPSATPPATQDPFALQSGRPPPTAPATGPLASVHNPVQWGDWTHFTFQNPTEGWMQNWNSLDPSLRPYYLYATEGERGSRNASPMAMWTALRNLGGLSEDQIRAARHQTVSAFNNVGQNWRVLNGQLQQGVIQPGGGTTWNNVAQLANQMAMNIVPNQGATRAGGTYSPAYASWLAQDIARGL